MFGFAVKHTKQPIIASLLYIAISLFSIFPQIVMANEAEFQKLIVADPYIDMHTGPGRGYPIFYVAERGAEIIILKSKTSWYKIRLNNNKEGWVHRAQLERTLTPGGEKKTFKSVQQEDYLGRKWEIGVLSGDADGYATMTLYGAYNFNDAMAAEFSVSQFLGDLASGYLWSIDLVSQPFPEWWVSPFFALGTGQIQITPNTTLIQSPDIKDNQAHVALGIKKYIAQRFLFRAEYRSYVVFQSRPENEEIEEWRAGFAFFF
jgi:hypothetical protein